MKRRCTTCLLVMVAALCSACALTEVHDEDPGGLLDLATAKRLAAEAYAAKNWADSEKYYATVTREVPQEVEPWFRLANSYARNQRPNLAVLAYREALVREPKLSKAWYNMGIVQLRQAANSFHEMQTHLDPSHPQFQQGRALYQRLMELMEHGVAAD